LPGAVNRLPGPAAIERAACLCQKQGWEQVSGVLGVSRNQILIGLVCVAVLVVAVAAYFMLTGPSSGNAGAVPQANERFGVAVTSYDRAQGSPKAPIVMLEYAAPSCPHCAHFDMDFFPQLKQQYIDTGKIYYIFRVFPLNAADVAAEGIARCLPADNYFPFIDLLFRNQVKWDPEYPGTDVHAGLLEMGRIVGLSETQADTCMSNQAVSAKVSQVGQEATTKYAINSTPTFIVNGQVHGPFTDWAEVKAFLDPMLPKK
jgi:protein-disulfide isomerase